VNDVKSCRAQGGKVSAEPHPRDRTLCDDLDSPQDIEVVAEIGGVMPLVRLVFPEYKAANEFSIGQDNANDKQAFYRMQR